VSQKTGRKVRLPTEAQWEYSCRAGSAGAYCFGDDPSVLDEYAWRADPNRNQLKFPHPVLTKKPNAFGLYDMHGNVAEWCRDLYDPNFYKLSPDSDPAYIDTYANENQLNVYRGGSFLFTNACRSADRQSGVPPSGSSLIRHTGFRVVVEIDADEAIASGGAKYVPGPEPVKVYGKWPFTPVEAKRRQQQTAASLNIKPVVTLPLGRKSTSVAFALIPAGMFVMGSPESDRYHRDDETEHEVEITKPFYMSTTEITEDQWRAATGASHSLAARRLSTLPVHKVTWSQAVSFCSALRKKTGLNVQIPSEAQWEYACRAGSNKLFSFGSYVGELHRYATYRPPQARSEDLRMSEVAQNRPNAFGLYDMHGNAYELCIDYYDAGFYARSPKSDPVNKIWKGGRFPTGVMRGGSWFHDGRLCRSASRATFSRGKGSDAGLRIVFSIPDKKRLASTMFKAIAPKK